VSRQAPDHQRAIAERNVEAILDAAERLMHRGEQPTIAAVAAEAAVSRVTVYAHFATREQLLEAALGRAVRHAASIFHVADVDAGSPVEALDRLLAAGWRMLERSSALARATASQLSSERRRHLHEPGLAPLRRLFERGQREGAFRSDVPVDWLLACTYALVHAAVDEVNAGRLPAATASRVLSASLHDLIVAGRGR
jgi:TetR/AcrR family transcriptional regulator, mexCD-oprJ operon repressor